MQNSNYIEFKKQRELGEILSDAFNFLKFEFKPLLSTLLKIVGPYFFTMLIAFAAYLYFIGDFTKIEDSNFSNVPEEFSLIIIIVVFFVLFVSIIATYVLTQAIVLYFIDSYINNRGKAIFDEVKSNAYKNFWKFVGLGILVGLSLMVGFLLCFIPGVYLYPILMLTFSIMVFNKTSVTEAYEKGFSLIKGEWWMTFLTLLVVGLIIGVISYIFQIPAYIYMMVKLGISANEVDAETSFNIFGDPIYIILNLLAMSLQFLLNLVTLITAALIYFNLNEKKNLTGSLEKIERLGSES